MEHEACTLCLQPILSRASISASPHVRLIALISFSNVFRKVALGLSCFLFPWGVHLRATLGISSLATWALLAVSHMVLTFHDPIRTEFLAFRKGATMSLDCDLSELSGFACHTKHKWIVGSLIILNINQMLLDNLIIANQKIIVIRFLDLFFWLQDLKK